MSLRWIPGFDYGDQQLRLSLPMYPWKHRHPSVGGRRISGAGVPASFIVRADEILELRLRLWEDEWPAYLDMVRYGQTSRPISFLPDINDPTLAALPVYLDSPEAGQDVTYEHEDGYGGLLTTSLQLRSVDGGSLFFGAFF